MAWRAFGRVMAPAVVVSALWSVPTSAQDVVKIGAPLALTGALADSGKKQKLGFDLWLERVNAAGGISVGGKKYKVELVTYDYQTDGKRAGELAEKLINEDKVSFMIAPFGSGHTKITAAVAERYGVPIVAVASSEAVHDQGFKNLFGALAPNSGLVDAMLTLFTREYPSLKKVAILGRDDVFPRDMAETLRTRAGIAGLEVVYSEFYSNGTIDHSAALAKIKGLAPDWIYITGYSQDLILARKQMHDIGLTAPIVTMITGPAYREFIEGLGPLAEGVTSVTWWHHTTTYESDDVWGSTKAFYEDFKSHESSDPDYIHAASAAALVAVQKAIENARSLEPTKISSALRALNLATFYGPIVFDEHGMNAARDLPILQVQGQEVKVLFPASIAQAQLAMFK